jgi:hypothetical protein
MLGVRAAGCLATDKRLATHGVSIALQRFSSLRDACSPITCRSERPASQFCGFDQDRTQVARGRDRSGLVEQDRVRDSAQAVPIEEQVPARTAEE